MKLFVSCAFGLFTGLLMARFGFRITNGHDTLLIVVAVLVASFIGTAVGKYLEHP